MMKVKVDNLKVGDIIANVPFGGQGEVFNAKVTSIEEKYTPETFEHIKAVSVKLYCIREEGTTFHAGLQLPEDSEWELIYRNDESEDIG